MSAVPQTSGPRYFVDVYPAIDCGRFPRGPVRAAENLMTGKRRHLEWGGLRLRIDPAADPLLLFRCLA